jgi:hypothetical protein
MFCCWKVKQTDGGDGKKLLAEGFCSLLSLAVKVQK